MTEIHGSEPAVAGTRPPLTLVKGEGMESTSHRRRVSFRPSDVRTLRVNVLRDQIASGEYEVCSETVAHALWSATDRALQVFQSSF